LIRKAGQGAQTSIAGCKKTVIVTRHNMDERGVADVWPSLIMANCVLDTPEKIKRSLGEGIGEIPPGQRPTDPQAAIRLHPGRPGFKFEYETDT
jgi:hypothetical protein